MGRKIVLFGLLLLSLGALAHRSRLQAWAYGIGEGTAALVGKQAPPLLAQKTLAGGQLRLADLTGRVVLLHFFTFG